VTVASSLSDAKDKMHKAILHLKEEMGSIRTGRASPALLSRITVDYYGATVPLQQLASITVPEPRTLMVQPFDKNSIQSIEKALQASDLGITPSNDGQVIRLSIPQLTEERRKDLIRVVHGRAEEGRVAVRNVRRHHKDELEKLEKDRAISEDDLMRAEKDLQKLTDQFISEVDEILVHKEQELKEI
jgi:ribosome recycling factor